MQGSAKAALSSMGLVGPQGPPGLRAEPRGAQLPLCFSPGIVRDAVWRGRILLSLKIH